jgi:hypothetical protein
LSNKPPIFWLFDKGFDEASRMPVPATGSGWVCAELGSGVERKGDDNSTAFMILIWDEPKVSRSHGPGLLLVAAIGVGILSSASASDLVVSQVYGGGGNSGAAYRNDFVEVFNRGTNTVHLTNWSIQYASAAGSNWQMTVLNSSIPPGRYLLIQQASSGASGLPLPTADIVGTIAMSSSAGKVALVSSTVPVSGPCPTRADLLDLVGYGMSASCFEGVAPAPAPGSGSAVLRATGGCVDSEQNGNDFFAASPSPRNSQAVPRLCSSIPTGPMALHTLQGTALASSFVGQQVMTTTNIVTAWRNDGFFLQAGDAEADNDSGTSEAIFVFTTTTPSATAAVGNAVVVEGIVEERRSANEANGLSRTQLINPLVRFISAGSPLLAPLMVSATNAGPGSAPDQLEPLEAMRVRVASLTVVGPTDGFLIESNAAGVSDGVFFGVVTKCPVRFVDRNFVARGSAGGGAAEHPAVRHEPRAAARGQQCAAWRRSNRGHRGRGGQQPGVFSISIREITRSSRMRMRALPFSATGAPFPCPCGRQTKSQSGRSTSSGLRHAG